MNNNTSQRPTAPHLQVYKFLFCMVLSISHRLTGLWLSLVAVFMTWFLVALAMGPQAYERTTYWLESGFGKTVFFISLAAFYYHMCNGVRHMVWDAGKGFEKHQAKLSGVMVLLAVVVLTLITWFGVPMVCRIEDVV